MKMFSRRYPVQMRIYYRGSPPLYFYFHGKGHRHGIAKCVFCVSNTYYEKRMQFSEKSVTWRNISREFASWSFHLAKFVPVNSGKI